MAIYRHFKVTRFLEQIETHQCVRRLSLQYADLNKVLLYSKYSTKLVIPSFIFDLKILDLADVICFLLAFSLYLMEKQDQALEILLRKSPHQESTLKYSWSYLQSKLNMPFQNAVDAPKIKYMVTSISGVVNNI